MQEDIENRAVALAIKSVKLTGHGLKVAIAKYLAHRKEQKLHTAPTGRQTVKQLMRQGQSVSNIEITDGNIKSFQRVAQRELRAEKRHLRRNSQIPGVLQGQGRGRIDRRLSGIRRPGNQTGKETNDSGAASKGAGQKKNAGACREA